MAGDTAGDTSTAWRAAEDGSPVPRRWLVIAGAGIMAAVILIAVFSLGVWVGSGRDDATTFAGFAAPGRIGGPPGQGAPGQQPGQGLRDQGPAAVFDALSRSPDVVGQVEWLEGDTIGVNSPAGSEVVTVSEETEIFLADGSPGSTRDIRRGRVVAVVGAPSDDGRSLRAAELAVMPDRP